jgi:carotenoid cleavage dioxygenase-like enzyme
MIFVVPPLAAAMLPSMLGLESIFESYRVLEGRASHIYLVSKDGSELVHLETDCIFVCHTIAARDVGDEVVIDFTRQMDWGQMFRRWRRSRAASRCPRLQSPSPTAIRRYADRGSKAVAGLRPGCG